MKNLFKKVFLTVAFVIPTISAYANYNTISVDGQYVSVETVLVEERILIQARSLVEALDATIEWDEEARLVTINHDSVIKLTIDHPIAYVDGVAQPLEAVPTIFNESTFLPLRFIAESLGFHVGFANGMVTILTPNFVPPTFAYLQEQGLLDDLEYTILFHKQNLVGEAIESGYYIVIAPMDTWGFFSVLNENGNVIFTDALLGTDVPNFIRNLLQGVEGRTTVYLLEGHTVDIEDFQYLLFVR
ncbi:MAG: copper amine oxidase N-terminal domain-containing protein [Defluviitaleaceae bacterium]|nr:copper amine oxidase N-terminal domain-containing protein [Defluviitaleaceae bacterium]